MANPPSSVAAKPPSAPDSLPIGVRAPATMTDPDMTTSEADGLIRPAIPQRAGHRRLADMILASPTHRAADVEQPLARACRPSPGPSTSPGPGARTRWPDRPSRDRDE